MKTYRLVFTKSYTRRAARFLRKHRQLVGQYERTLALLERDPFHPALRIHKLTGRLSGLHAVSINIAYRISLILVIEESAVIPVDVGTHDEVYRG